MSEKVFGGKINRIVKQRCEEHKEFFDQKLITIIMFEPPSREKNPQKISQYEAAVVSTNQKVKTFEFIGCQVNRYQLPGNTEPNEFAQLIEQAVNNLQSIGIIVQNPLPSPDLAEELHNIPPKLDIDGVNLLHPIFKASATSEAVARLVESFASPSDKVAVVGSRGFVGQGIVKLLKEKEITVIELDIAQGNTKEDIRQGLLNANLVVSATGQPNLITKDFLKAEHKLVVDTGFIPQSEGQPPLGDVAKDAYDIPQRITPVPGGVGPIQMAVLLERIMRMAQIQIQSWDYNRDIVPLIQNLEL